MDRLEIEKIEISKSEYERNREKAVSNVLSKISNTQEMLSFVEKAIYLNTAKDFENICEMILQGDIGVAYTLKNWNKKGYDIIPGAKVYYRTAKNKTNNNTEEYMKFAVYSVNDLVHLETRKPLTKEEIETLKKECSGIGKVDREYIEESCFRALNYYDVGHLAKGSVEEQVNEVLLSIEREKRPDYGDIYQGKEGIIEALKTASYLSCLGLGLEPDARAYNIEYNKLKEIKQEAEKIGNNILSAVKDTLSVINRDRKLGKPSKGEEIVDNYLNELKIDGMIDSSGRELQTKRGEHRYDFFVRLENNKNEAKVLLIEYDGKQHFQDNKFYNTTAEESRRKDEEKNTEARKKGYEMLRIPYTKRPEEVEKMIEEKILQIKRG